jgi:hypothetical protein
MGSTMFSLRQVLISLNVINGIRTWEWLRWREPATIVNDRPILSSERMLNKDYNSKCSVGKNAGRESQGAWCQNGLAEYLLDSLKLVTTNNWQSHRVPHYKDRCNYTTHKVLSVSSSRCLVSASMADIPLLLSSRIAPGLTYQLLPPHNRIPQLTQLKVKDKVSVTYQPIVGLRNPFLSTSR